MAHKSNVTQVIKNFIAPTRGEVTDPICGKRFDRSSARNLLFREQATYYFCSKECQNKFIYPARAPKLKAA